MVRPDLPLEEATFIAFDTETTGLYPVVGRLVEIGAVRFRSDGEEVASFEQLIDPEVSIPPDAQAVNHITDDMVRGQPCVDDVLPQFLDFLDGLDNILIAQNAPFDIEFIGVDLIRLGMPLPRHIVFDTKLLAQALMPGLVTYALQSLGTMLGVMERQTHRALSDSQLTKRVFLSLLRKDHRLKTVADIANRIPMLSFEQSRVYQVKPPRGFEQLAPAMEKGLSIEMVYQGGTRGDEPRRVTPRALLQSGGYIYMAAFCHADGRDKMYRLDRIESYSLTG